MTKTIVTSGIISLGLPLSLYAGSQETPTPDATQDLWEGHLAGDMFGLRPCLATHGIKLDLTATNFYYGVVDGSADFIGGKDGDDVAFGGKVDLHLNVDGHKAGLWQGLFISVHGEYRYGDSTRQAGALTPVNAGMLSPSDNSDAFAFTNVVITQAFSESVLLSLGKFNTIDLADKTFLGGFGYEGFMNTSFVAPPIAGRTVPISTLGAIVSVLDGGKPKFNIGIIDSDSPETSSGFDGLSSDEMTFLADYTFYTKIGGKDGTHTISGTYSTIDAFSLEASDYLRPPSNPGITPAFKDDSWQISYTFEQFICQDASDPKKGWGVFGMFAFSDGNPNPFEYSAVLGIAANGVSPSRPNDNFGFGLFWNGVSDDLQKSLDAVVDVDDEYGAELFYDAAITPWFRLGADVQVVNPVFADNDTAVFLGLRSRVIF
ncbi:hypothetical protein Rhal01_00622 [Rubritalea halochordaticola]|uniref:Carbohydrate porin n=1 Tax=Rubritalea halochordaticola TaxID=714537 RepID=A0ABP9UVG5_9BACT